MQRDADSLPKSDLAAETAGDGAALEPLAPTPMAMVATMLICLTAFVWICLIVRWVVDSLVAREVIPLIGVFYAAAILTLAIVQVRGVYGRSLPCATLSSGVMTGLMLTNVISAVDLLLYFPTSVLLTLPGIGFLATLAVLGYGSLAMTVWARCLVTHARGLRTVTPTQFSFRTLMIGVTLISVMIAALMNIRLVLFHFPVVMLATVVVLSALAVPDDRFWLPESMPARDRQRETSRFAVWLVGAMGAGLFGQDEVLGGWGFEFGTGVAELLAALGVSLYNILAGVAIAGIIALLVGCRLSRWFSVAWPFVGVQLVCTIVMGELDLYSPSRLIPVIAWSGSLVVSALAFVRARSCTTIFGRRSRMLAG